MRPYGGIDLLTDPVLKRHCRRGSSDLPPGDHPAGDALQQGAMLFVTGICQGHENSIEDISN
jgi:hypothetical protein